jgi:hypothetical protein
MNKFEKYLDGVVFITPAYGTEEFKPYYSVIVDTWAKSYRPVTAGAMIQPLYDIYQRKMINSILAVSNIIIATNKDNPTEIFGYIIWQNGKFGSQVHWTYVKHPFRGLGLATYLYNLAPKTEGYTDFAHFPPSPGGQHFCRSLKLTFNPYHNFSGMVEYIEHNPLTEKKNENT